MRLAIILLTSGLLSAQQASQPAPSGEALHPSFGLQDPTILSGRGSKKPVLGKAPAAPRLKSGKVDLSGPWAPNAIAENVNMVATGLQIPFNAKAKAIYDERIGNLGKDDPEARCLPPGVPRMTTTPYPFRFVQQEGGELIFIVYEGGAHVWRQIYMDGRGFSKFADNLWNGESIGHWEGDTLVIQTQGFNDLTWIDAAGVPHSDQLKVTERITRLDRDNLEYLSIVDDPTMFTKPWGFTTYPKRQEGELLEYVCNENEKDVQHLKGK